MKNLHISAVLLSAAAAMSFGCVSAAAASLSASTDLGSVSYTYSDAGIESGTADASGMFDFDGVIPGASETAQLEVTSSSRDETEVYLRLNVNDAESSYKVLDRYSFRITDESGNLVYNSTEADMAVEGDGYKDIPLGIFNSQFVDDTKKFNVEYTANHETDLPENGSDRGFSVMLNAKPVENEQSMISAETIQLAPAEPDKGDDAAAAQAAADASETPEADPTLASKIKTKVCGKDIDPGRYTVSGNGKVIITDKNGTLLDENVVTDGTVEGVNGVKKFTVTLNDGDVIVIAPVGGMEKATLRFENVLPDNQAKTQTGASSNSADKASLSAKASEKTNPKTGDAAKTAVGAAAVLMLLSGAGIFGIEALKKRKNNG